MYCLTGSTIDLEIFVVKIPFYGVCKLNIVEYSCIYIGYKHMHIFFYQRLCYTCQWSAHTVASILLHLTYRRQCHWSMWTKPKRPFAIFLWSLRHWAQPSQQPHSPGRP